VFAISELYVELDATGGQASTMAVAKARALISQNAVVVFSKSYCPFCVRVKSLLKSIGAEMKVVELDEESDGSDIQAALAKLSGQRTVPNVFIGGQHIGGCDDTTAMHKKGQLLPLLNGAGALKPVTA
jgi:glutaredoxin 3